MEEEYKYHRVCLGCGKEFGTNHHRTAYCSIGCKTGNKVQKARTERLYVSKLQKDSLADPLVFSREVLGYDKLLEYPHGEILRLLMSEKRRNKGIEMPRGSFKTTVMHAASIYKSMIDPDIRILYSSSTYGNAVKSIRAIRSHFDSNSKFISTFGKMGSKGGSTRWSDMEITLNSRRKGFLKEATFSASGVDSPRTGMHYDLIIADDLHDDENTKTKEQMDKVKEYFRRLFFLLDPQQGELWFDGTRYSIYDLYGWIHDNMEKHFLFYVKTVYDGVGSPSDPKHVYEKPNESTFLLPDIMGTEEISRLKSIMLPETFSGQMLNRPQSSDGNPFKEEDARFYLRDEDIPREVDYVMTVDPATSTEKSADFSAIVVGAWDQKNRCWVKEAWQEKVESPDLIEKIFEFVIKYEISEVGIEAGMLLNVLKFPLETAMANKGVYFVLHPLRGWDRHTSKKNRIGRLIPYWMNHVIILKKGMDELLYQLCVGGLHDDLCLVGDTKIATLFGDKNIKDIKVGDLVLTPNGLSKVKNSRCTGKKRVISKLGLRGTPNHKIYTTDQFLPLDTITYHDKISLLNLREVLSWAYRKLLYTEVKHISLVTREDIIFAGKLKMEKGLFAHFIGKFGKIITEKKFLKAFTFTIKMATLLITHLTIYSVYRLMNTIIYLKKWMWKKIINFLKKLDLLLLNGIGAKKAEHGIGYMEKSVGKIIWCINLFVNVVVKSLAHPFGELCIVGQPANKNTDGIVELTMKKENVVFAEKNSSGINTSLEKPVPSIAEVSCEVGTYTEVYNIKTGDGVYYANKILLSNCDALAYQIELQQPTITPQENDPQKKKDLVDLSDREAVGEAFKKEKWDNIQKQVENDIAKSYGEVYGEYESVALTEDV